MAESRGQAILNKTAAVAKADVQKNTLKTMVKSMESGIKRALPAMVNSDRFIRVVMTAISSNRNLAKCTPESFLGAMMTSAQYGLEPNTPSGYAYLIPYGNSCQFQIGYRGLIRLFYNDPNAQNIEAHVVYENDEFEYELGLEPKLRHVPCKGDRGEAIAYYAIWKLKNGGYGYEVMSRKDIENHRDKFSKAKESPWKTNFDEMAKKTVIKRALKYAPLSIEIQEAMSGDEKIVKRDITGKDEDYVEYIDITDLTEDVPDDNDQQG